MMNDCGKLNLSELRPRTRRKRDELPCIERRYANRLALKRGDVRGTGKTALGRIKKHIVAF